jgi:hypothetical protein
MSPIPAGERKKAAEIVSGLSGKNTCLNEIVAPAPDASFKHGGGMSRSGVET